MSRILRPHLPLFTSLLLLAAAAFFAMNSQNNLLFWVVGMLAAAIVLSFAFAWLSMRKLHVRRLDPKHGVVGEPLAIRYAITNRNRFLPAFNIVIQENGDRGNSNWRQFMSPASAWVMHVGPGETVHGEAIVWPRARGEVRFDRLRYWTRFPFGIFRRTRRASQVTRTLIFPRVHRLRRGVLDAIVPAGPLGMKLSLRPGGGDDYFGLREYKPGDSRRQIAWKRSAGSDTLIITERTVPSPPRIRIVLNLTAPTAQISGVGRAEPVSSESASIAKEGGHSPPYDMSPRELEERAISLVATLVEAGYRTGYEVGLSVLGVNLPVTPLRCSYWHVEKIMAALASIDLDAARSPIDSRALADAERCGMVVVHPGRVDPRVVRTEAWHFSAMQLERLIDPLTGPVIRATKLTTRFRPPPRTTRARRKVARAGADPREFAQGAGA